MVTPEVQLSDQEKHIHLKGASAIGITASAATEKNNGRSTARFIMSGQDASGEEPFNTLTRWYEQQEKLTVHIADKSKLGECSLRECTWNPSAGELYVTIYTKESPADLRKLFSL